MANDRLWLSCPCGEKILLFKYYPNRNGYVKHTQDELDEWITDHIDRCSGAQNHFKGTPPFKLEVESYDDKKQILDQMTRN